MNEFTEIFAARLFITASGLVSIILGYKLFAITTQKQGEFRLKNGHSFELSLCDVAPGVFFALFGAIILSVSLLNPLTHDGSDQDQTSIPGAEVDPSAPPQATGSPKAADAIPAAAGSATPVGAKDSAREPPRKPLVWQNTKTHIYHDSGGKFYGKTLSKSGREADAAANVIGDDPGPTPKGSSSATPAPPR